ncbi:hypothetical protein LINPERPRIM_LOCUS25771 [Linum perenne]
MFNCIPSHPLPISIFRARNNGFDASSSPVIYPHKPPNFRFNFVYASAGTNRGEFGPQYDDFLDEVGFRKKGKRELEFQSVLDQEFTRGGVVRLKGEERRKKQQDLQEEEEEYIERRNGGRVKSRRDLAKRSSLLAKQVISVRSALSLGFISQLWVDPTNWAVVVIEVRPHLLSGESARFLLQDIRQVGDVVLVKDEKVLDAELNIAGLETLVGYQVFTPSQRNIGKVRGFSFNINSGTVDSLELDSFGISIIPSSLVSTYTLPAEDVVDVFRDIVIVDEDAASRIQRLTKGLWDPRPTDAYEDEVGEYADTETGGKRRSKRPRRKTVESESREDEWELPMDYL